MRDRVTLWIIHETQIVAMGLEATVMTFTVIQMKVYQVTRTPKLINQLLKKRLKFKKWLKYKILKLRFCKLKLKSKRKKLFLRKSLKR